MDSFGHVNNASYLSLFEEARWAFGTQNGYGFKEVQEHQKGPIVLEVTIKFLKELKLGDWITIRSEILDYEGKIGHIKQEIFRDLDDAHPASTAVFVFGFFDLRLRKLILPTPEWLKAIGY